MTPPEWLDTGVSIANNVSPDLFGGDLFGDELMDMYNSAADVGDDSTGVENEIPSLLTGTSELDISRKEDECMHAGAHIAMTAAAMDDGFGAFRPCTSFNDLATLLTPAAATSTPAIVLSTVTSLTNQMAESTRKETGRKRVISDGVSTEASEGSASKKRATGPKARNSSNGSPGRRGVCKATKSVSSGKSSAVKTGPPSAGLAALKLRKEQQDLLNSKSAISGNNTPNPLTVGAPARPTHCSAVAPMKHVVIPATILSPPLSSRLSGGGKGDSITSEAAAATAAAAAVAAAISVPSTPMSGLTTEADFKSVAQAAVTNLILNVGSGPKSDMICSASVGSTDAESDNFDDLKIDTSTAHIKALTSSNWVNACGGVDSAAENAAAAAVVADSKANNRARRQNLTPDERARQNRDRNREHARNTRLRKKAYVEELKRTLTELVSQRDAAELEKRHSAQRELEQREVRFRVMEEFLKLRGRNEPNFARWVAILEEGFILTLPSTRYRKMVHGTGNGVSSGNLDVFQSSQAPNRMNEQLLRGADDVMSDSAYLASFIQSIGSTSVPQGKSTPGTTVSLVYHCERKHFFMDGCVAVLEWTAATMGATSQGASSELRLKGTMRASFSPASNKLITADLVFDTASVASQLLELISPTASRENTVNADAVAAAAAAQAAANEADALLDSIQMPQLSVAVPSAITMPQSNAIRVSTAISVTSSEKEDCSSDESMMGSGGQSCAHNGVVTRRSARVKE